MAWTQMSTGWLNGRTEVQPSASKTVWTGRTPRSGGEPSSWEFRQNGSRRVLRPCGPWPRRGDRTVRPGTSDFRAERQLSPQTRLQSSSSASREQEMLR